MTAPAAPLDAAVEEAREAVADALRIIDKWIAGYKGPPKSELAGHILILSEALRSLLAALDADKRLEEAEAALREIDNQGCEHRTPCLQHVGMGACPRCIARRYFARREGEKGEDREG